jgi:hypothetical protein
MRKQFLLATLVLCASLAIVGTVTVAQLEGGNQPDERNKSLQQFLATKYELKKTSDTYFFLTRLGSNYDVYKFSWESFRDLAGPLEGSNNSLPIVILSDSTNRLVPTVTRAQDPIGHYEIWVSPNLDAPAIANVWLELLVDAGARHGQYKGPFEWFVQGLRIKREQLTKKSRDFLSL